MTKKKTIKLVAVIALLAIFGSIIGTGALIIFETYFSSNKNEKTLSQSEINELLKSYSGSLNSTGININTSTGIIDNTLTGTNK